MDKTQLAYAHHSKLKDYHDKEINNSKNVYDEWSHEVTSMYHFNCMRAIRKNNRELTNNEKREIFQNTQSNHLKNVIKAIKLRK